jgi:hypothetical protein
VIEKPVGKVLFHVGIKKDLMMMVMMIVKIFQLICMLLEGGTGGRIFLSRKIDIVIFF